MEQYFEITNQSSHYKEYFDYLEADEACRKAVKEFIEENNIHTEHYAVFGGALWIDNNQENREKYGNQLKKDGDDGLAAFKKTNGQNLRYYWNYFNVNINNIMYANVEIKRKLIYKK